MFLFCFMKNKTFYRDYLRERFKVGLAWVLPGVDSTAKNYRKSQDMEWDKYSFEILDRSGILGPFGLLIPMYEAGKYGDFPLGPAAGPTFERIEDLIFDFEVKQNIPVLGTLL